jgi:hypothetical protein
MRSIVIICWWMLNCVLFFYLFALIIILTTQILQFLQNFLFFAWINPLEFVEILIFIIQLFSQIIFRSKAQFLVQLFFKFLNFQMIAQSLFLSWWKFNKPSIGTLGIGSYRIVKPMQLLFNDVPFLQVKIILNFMFNHLIINVNVLTIKNLQSSHKTVKID